MQTPFLRPIENHHLHWFTGLIWLNQANMILYTPCIWKPCRHHSYRRPICTWGILVIFGSHLGFGIKMTPPPTRTRWRRVKTLGQHQVGVNLQSHAQHQLWISTWHIFDEFHKIMPSLSYPVSLVNQNVVLVNISHWWLHMAWIMSLMST